MRSVIGDERTLRLLFRIFVKYSLNLEDPQTFSEKIQWIKLFGGLDRFSAFADKYEVRAFVERRVGSDHLIPIAGVYESFDEIDFSSLPTSFAIKATHGSGWIAFVSDKDSCDVRELRRMAERWLRTNFASWYGEAQYRPLRGRIIIEELVGEPPSDLADYRFFCYAGVPRVIQFDLTQAKQQRRDFYTPDWKRLDVLLRYGNFSPPPPAPRELDQMLQIAETLSRGFPFLRVDLYAPGDRVLFGELTLTPGQGFRRFFPREWDYEFGRNFDISAYAKGPPTA